MGLPDSFLRSIFPCVLYESWGYDQWNIDSALPCWPRFCQFLRGGAARFPMGGVSIADPDISWVSAVNKQKFTCWPNKDYTYWEVSALIVEKLTSSLSWCFNCTHVSANVYFNWVVKVHLITHLYYIHCIQAPYICIWRTIYISWYHSIFLLKMFLIH